MLTLKEAYKQVIARPDIMDQDLYKEMAALMLDKKVDDVTPEERHNVKMLMFPIIYGDELARWTNESN